MQISRRFLKGAGGMIANGKKIGFMLCFVPAVVLAALIAVKCISVIRIALIALVISYLLSPVVDRLSRKMPKSASVLIIYAALIALAAGAAAVILLPVIKELSSLPEYSARLGNLVKALPDVLSKRFEGIELPEDMFYSIQNALGRGSGKILTFAVSAFSAAAGFFADVLIAIALSWFFLMDWDKLSLRLFLCVPSGIRPKIITALKTVRRDLGGYLRAQGMLMGIMFIITASAFFVVGIPMPVSLAVTYAILNAVPYFGPLIGTVPPVLAALTISPVKAVFILAVLLLIQQIDNYILSPRIMGAASNSGPAAILIAISAGGAVFGAAGMFLALPALVSFKSVYRVFTAPKT